MRKYANASLTRRGCAVALLLGVLATGSWVSCGVEDGLPPVTDPIVSPDPNPTTSQPASADDDGPVPGLQKPLAYYYSTTPIHHRINCGGPAYTDPAGNEWVSDDGFYNTGKTFSVNQAIAGTEADPIFQTERWDKPGTPELTYSIPVPAGVYRLRLYFSENYGATSQVGRRVFDVVVEGAVVLDDYDIFARAGPLTASVEEATVNVTDDSLTIEFRHGVENPKIAAIEVETISTASPPVIEGGPSQTMSVGLNSECGAASNRLTLTATDSDTGVESLAWSVSMPAAHGAATFEGTSSGRAVTLCYQPDAFTVGTDLFEVQVSDGAGGVDTVQVAVTVSGDLPTISITAPAAGATIVGDMATLSWISSGDLIGVDHVRIRLDTGTPVTSSQFSGLYTFMGLSGGSHSATFELVDGAENPIPLAGASASIQFTTQMVAPSVPPTISISSPANGAVLTSGSVPVIWAASGNLSTADHVHLRLDGGPHVTVQGFTGTYTFANVTAGSHTVSAQLASSDHMMLQNPEAMASVNFTVQLPTIPGISVAPTSIDFGYVVVGAASGSMSVQIENTGQTPLTLESIALAGPAAGDFVVSSPVLPLTIVIGGSQNVGVMFSPTAASTRAATMTIQSTEIATPLTVPLSGNGFAQTTGGAVVYRVNCGGPAYVDPDGNTWSADTGFYNTGSTFSTNDAIANTEMDPLYRTERWDKPAAPEMIYSFAVDNGSYEVRLHLAEIYGALQQTGRRVFDVMAEGQLFSNDLDIFARAGGDTALIETFTVNVSDGVLNIEFRHVVENPAVNAIEIRRSGGSAGLLASPGTIEWGHVAIGQTGGTRTIQLVNAGDAPAVISSLAFLVNAGAGHEFRATLGGTTFVGDHNDVAFGVNVVIGPGQSLVVPVEFVPSEEEEHDVNLEIVGNFATQRVRLLGVGGANPGHPFLHVVISAPAVTVDYDLDGSEPVALMGSESHTHELGHVLAGFEWREGGQLLSTEVNPTLNLAVGEHTLTLKIIDDNSPPETLTDSATIKVVGPNAVPGAMALFYPDAGGGGATALLDSIPPDAKFGEVLNTIRIQANGNLLGGSPYGSNVMVRLLEQIDLLVAGTYAFAASGGSAQRLFVDGSAVTGPLAMSAGRHAIEARFAVASIADAPLSVTYALGAGAQIEIPSSLITHDQLAMKPVLNSMPSGGGAVGGEQVELLGLGFFPESSVVVRWGAQTISDSALTVTPTSIRFTAPAGSGTISVAVETPNGTSNSKTYTYSSGGPAPIVFTLSDLVSTGINGATTAEWGSDGRLYVGTIDGIIKAYTFDDQYSVTATQTINTLSSLTNKYILGMAVNPLDASGTVRIYVAHSQIYANGGACFTGFSPYSGQVSVLTGPNFNTVQPLITGLPVSNHDHAINGMQFDNNGDLFLCIGGNTNAGVEHCNLGALPESPLTAAVIKAATSKSNFSGQITYRRSSDGSTTNDQVNGGVVDLAPGLDVEVFASGLRNPYDIVFTTRGLLYATDNGPNGGFGAASTSATTQSNSDPTAGDELNLIEEKNYYGHPNRNRGRYDDRQNVYRGPTVAAIQGVFTQMLTSFSASTDGITEYRANTFNGAMRGDLLAQKWNGQTYRIKLSSNGRSVASKQDLPTAMSSLDVLTGPGGVVIGVDYTGNKLSIARPQATAGLAVYDIFPWRAPTSGGRSFVIGGNGFGTLANTSVAIDGFPATLTSVSATRIRGVIPARASAPASMVDVVVTVSGTSSVLSSAFRYLSPPAGTANGAAASMVVDDGGSLADSSTYSPGSFQIRNDSTQSRKITQVRIDLSSAVLPDMVFDPDGTAGDSASKPFSANQQGGAGLIGHGYDGPHDNGFDQLIIDFGDFDPGETFTFSIDIDPTSIQGSSPGGPSETGAVSGLELTGARVTAVFDNGATLVGSLFRLPSSVSGGEVRLSAGTPAAPSILAVGAPLSPSTVSSANQTIRVSGATGSTVRLLRMEGGLYTSGLPGGGFDIDPYEANTVVALTEQTVTIGAGGFVNVPVTLTRMDSNSGINQIAAIVTDGAGRMSLTSNTVTLRMAP